MDDLKIKQENLQRLKTLRLRVKYIQDDYLPVVDIDYRSEQSLQFLYQYSTSPRLYPSGLVDWGSIDNSAIFIMQQLSKIFYDLLVMIECTDLNSKTLLGYAWDFIPQYHVELNWLKSIGFPLLYDLDKLDVLITEVSDIFQNRAGYVYLLRAINPTENYKIGRSKDPVKRVESLGVKLPFPIQPIHLIKTDDMYILERYYHELYAKQRIKGEWFTLSKTDIAAFTHQSFIFVEDLKG